MQLSLPLNTPEDEETSQRVDLPQVDLMSFLPSERRSRERSKIFEVVLFPRHNRAKDVLKVYPAS